MAEYVIEQASSLQNCQKLLKIFRWYLVEEILARRGAQVRFYDEISMTSRCGRTRTEILGTPS